MWHDDSAEEWTGLGDWWSGVGDRSVWCVCVCVCVCVRQSKQSAEFLVSSLVAGQTAGYKLKESRVG